ncbi:MAG: TraR/DksA family transcriptional regulator [Candidatus Nitrohelix vancouverensis]|uniref:TraR/DksA family transcriptional regulator n=1 Tax=Candidatus Nitrohelix vancouverensis TaxID=2705534 RepID=A0A7T0C0Y0_9BACT|nr:MAG: TraR/DksA family transcriptional regulator [Candidatus Nitrohelix vancouverensis]
MKQKESEKYLSKLMEIRTGMGIDAGIGSNKGKKFENGPTPDIADEAVETYAKDIRMNLGEQEWQKFKLIEEAIDNIKNGCYGLCAECENPIPPARLEIIPFAKFCVNCLSKMENNSGSARTDTLQ